MASYYQMVMGVERCRAPEVIFQPTMVGVDQGGVSSTLEYILQTYPSDIQQRLVDVSYMYIHVYSCFRLQPLSQTLV